MRRSLAILCASIAVAAGCGGSEATKEDLSDDAIADAVAEQTPVSRKEAAALADALGGDARPRELPDGWTRVRDGMWAAPESGSELRPNVNVLQGAVPDGSPKLTAQDILLEEVRYTKRLSDGRFDQIATGDVEVMGEDGRSLEYVSTIGKLRLHVLEYFVVKDGSQFAITGAALESEWPEARADLVSVLESFEIGASS